MRGVSFLLLALTTGCGFTPRAIATDGRAPDGAMTGDAPTPDAPLLDLGSCTVAGTRCADDSTLVTCTGGGATPVAETCPWSCLDAQGAEAAQCGIIHPAGGVVTGADLSTAGVSAVMLTGSFSTDATQGPAGTVLSQRSIAGSPGVTVLRAASFDITGGLQITGSRGLALVADGPITIEANAVIDIGGKGATPGPGASTIQGTGGNGTGNDGGGGGGARGGNGGVGGSGGGTPGAAGTEFGDAGFVTTPLIGGGAGGTGSVTGGAGGGGGGAIQLLSASRIVIMAGGGITAGGGGGQGGVIGGHPGGGGGGAGGVILLEAPTIQLDGELAVDGGGGGAGQGSAGQDGAIGATAAAGGTGTNNGGPGGAGTTLDGTKGTSTPKAGGGGGGVGRIRINTLHPPAAIGGGATLSPSPSAPGSTTTEGAVDVERS